MTTAKKVTGGKVRYAIVGAGWISQTALLPGVEHTGNSVVTTIVTARVQNGAAAGQVPHH